MTKRLRRPPPADLSGQAIGTRLVHAGRGPGFADGIVNPPVWRASTMLFDSCADLDAGNAAPDGGLYYGRRGSPTQWALEDALTALEPGAAGTKLLPFRRRRDHHGAARRRQDRRRGADHRQRL